MYPLRSFKMLLRFPKTLEAQYSTDTLKLNKVLVLHKLSKLELERLSQPDLNDQELEKCIKNKGIDYESLVEHHSINKKFREYVYETFQKLGIHVKSVHRFDCSQSDIEWCDAVFPVGGDGTFLHTSRYIQNNKKPVIGFNSDPSRSEGFLCLPKKYSSDVAGAITKLLEGKFKWMFRTRIRINISGDSSQGPPTELHDVNVHKCKLPNIEGKVKTGSKLKPNKITQTLPVLALNEVFMSEIFAARVSFFEMRMNDSQQSVKIKSSGLCVCTGTGSTSWHLSINRLSRQDVHDILKHYISETNGTIPNNFEELVTNVSNRFNEVLKFGPEKQILGYTVRDLISVGVWPSPKGLIERRGFANTIEVKSKCYEAGLIVDGGVSFPFNEGAVAFLETRPEDALRTVILSE